MRVAACVESQRSGPSDDTFTIDGLDMPTRDILVGVFKFVLGIAKIADMQVITRIYT